MNTVIELISLNQRQNKKKEFWPRLVCSVLVNSDTLTTNYGVKQSQFTKSTSESRASDPEESNEAFDRTI